MLSVRSRSIFYVVGEGGVAKGEHVHEVVRGSAEIRDVGEGDADVGFSRKLLQSRRPSERQDGRVPPDAVAVRHDLLDLEGRRVDADAIEGRRLPKAVRAVECDGEFACVLQFGDERERQELSAAKGEAEVVVEKYLLHGAEDAPFLALSLLAEK